MALKQDDVHFNRVCILGIFVLNRVMGFKLSAAYLEPNIGQVLSPEFKTLKNPTLSGSAFLSDPYKGVTLPPRPPPPPPSGQGLNQMHCT